MPYTTEANIEGYIGVDIPASKSAYVAVLIAAVTAWINNYIGKSYSAISGVKYYDGSGAPSIFTDPLQTVTAVEILDSNGNVTQVLSADDYILYPLNNTIKDTIYIKNNYWCGFLSQSSSDQPRRVKVSATFGAGATVPDDIQMAATMLASDLYNVGNSADSEGTVSSESLGDYSVTYSKVNTSGSSNMTVTGILDMYRDIII